MKEGSKWKLDFGTETDIIFIPSKPTVDHEKKWMDLLLTRPRRQTVRDIDQPVPKSMGFPEN